MNLSRPEIIAVLALTAVRATAGIKSTDNRVLACKMAVADGLSHLGVDATPREVESAVRDAMK